VGAGVVDAGVVGAGVVGAGVVGAVQVESHLGPFGMIKVWMRRR